MTADDARQITKKATSPDDAMVRIVLDLWYAAIKKAAAAGRDSVRESECDRVRTLITACARAAAIEQLRRDGFTASYAATDRNETEMTVSWARQPLPPRGGTGTPPGTHQ